ncbi:hypothetical protein GCM10012285_55810 [Streptomyces kronopolitis]|uniref:Uncharacterized protein n=1 Tax=Streptomyces kronopolitis TaxID=1612435 RepID=A0ABQ2JW15_9ACTN|nr:hypothetical protein GCM10012285_55810 [Streptomyces kronopolitis]
MSAAVGSVGSVWGGGVSMCAFGEVSGERGGRTVPRPTVRGGARRRYGPVPYRLSAESTASQRFSYQGRCAARGPFGAEPVPEPSWTR